MKRTSMQPDLCGCGDGYSASACSMTLFTRSVPTRSVGPSCAQRCGPKIANAATPASTTVRISRCLIEWRHQHVVRHVFRQAASVAMRLTVAHTFRSVGATIWVADCANSPLPLAAETVIDGHHISKRPPRDDGVVRKVDRSEPIAPTYEADKQFSWPCRVGPVPTNSSQPTPTPIPYARCFTCRFPSLSDFGRDPVQHHKNTSVCGAFRTSGEMIFQQVHSRDRPGSLCTQQFGDDQRPTMS